MQSRAILVTYKGVAGKPSTAMVSSANAFASNLEVRSPTLIPQLDYYRSCEKLKFNSKMSKSCQTMLEQIMSNRVLTRRGVWVDGETEGQIRK